VAARPRRRPGAQARLFERYKQLVLLLLVVAYTFNFIDRTIIATIGQAIKVDLKLTDTQLGLLGGLYFALLYTSWASRSRGWPSAGAGSTSSPARSSSGRPSPRSAARPAASPAGCSTASASASARPASRRPATA
jgi:hypothetical protein